MFTIIGCVPGDILCMGTDDDPQCISELNICDGLIQCPAGDDELNGSCSKALVFALYNAQAYVYTHTK